MQTKSLGTLLLAVESRMPSRLSIPTTIVVVMCLLSHVACGSGDDEDDPGTTFTSNSGSNSSGSGSSGSAPASLAGSLLRLSPDSAASASFTSTSCTLPNYSPPSDYTWAHEPECEYSKTSGSTGSYSMLYLIETQNAETLYVRVEKYTYDITLRFSGPTSGTYSGTLLSESVTSKGSPKRATTADTKAISGTFSLR